MRTHDKKPKKPKKGAGVAIGLLVCAVDRLNPNKPDSYGLYKRGMIIDVRDSPVEGTWGVLERASVPAVNWIITIEGVSIVNPEVNTWTSERFTVTPNPDTGYPDSIGRRELYLDVDALPAPIRNDILDDGYATIGIGQLQAFRNAIKTYDWGD